MNIRATPSARHTPAPVGKKLAGFRLTGRLIVGYQSLTSLLHASASGRV
jgi:hypothetical protein